MEQEILHLERTSCDLYSLLKRVFCGLSDYRTRNITFEVRFFLIMDLWHEEVYNI